jgi:hypothetical protein
LPTEVGLQQAVHFFPIQGLIDQPCYGQLPQLLQLAFVYRRGEQYYYAGLLLGLG